MKSLFCKRKWCKSFFFEISFTRIVKSFILLLYYLLKISSKANLQQIYQKIFRFKLKSLITKVRWYKNTWIIILHFYTTSTLFKEITYMCDLNVSFIPNNSIVTIVYFCNHSHHNSDWMQFLLSDVFILNGTRLNPLKITKGHN